MLDAVLGYRVCAFNHAHHDGTHIHWPETGRPLATVGLTDPQDTEAVMRRFARHADHFDLDRFLKEVNEWRSVSDAQ